MRGRVWIGLCAAFVVAAAAIVIPAAGLGPFRAPCAAAAEPGASFTPIAPQRVLDTRFGPGPTGPLLAGAPLTLDLAGRVPAGTTAVVLNLTGVDASVPNFLEAWPTGTPPPNASNVNLVPNQARGNLVTVALGTGAAAGKVSILVNAGAANVVADLAGYYVPGTAGAGYTPRSPARALDTRTTIGNNRGVLGPQKTITVDLSPVVPPTATAVVATLTGTDVTAATFFTAWPSGSALPNASNLNLVAGGTAANLVTVSTGPGEKVNIYNSAGSADAVLDVAGYFAPGAGGLFVPLSPTRVLDTRDGTGAPAGRVGAGGTVVVDTAPAVPASGTAAVVNVTGVAPSAYTHLTAWPDRTARPNASNVNLATGEVTASLASIRLGGGKFDLFNNEGDIDLVADVSGYYVDRPPCGAAPPPAASYAPAPTRPTGTLPSSPAPGTAPSPSAATVAPAPAGATGRSGGGDQSEIDQRNGAPNR